MISTTTKKIMMWSYLIGSFTFFVSAAAADYSMQWATSIQKEIEQKLIPTAEHTLILIGYFDQVDSLKATWSHPHNNQQAQTFQLQLESHLLKNGFRAKKTALWTELSRQNKNYYLFNVNTSCAGASVNNHGEEIRSSYHVCEEQQELIQTAQVLLNNLKLFDQFIFFGHSRLGKGLGIGPFIPNSTYGLVPQTNQGADSTSEQWTTEDIAMKWTNGRLKSVSLIGCKTKQYYEKVIKFLGFNFFGTHQDVSWSPIPERNMFLQLFAELIKSDMEARP